MNKKIEGVLKCYFDRVTTGAGKDGKAGKQAFFKRSAGKAGF